MRYTRVATPVREVVVPADACFANSVDDAFRNAYLSGHELWLASQTPKFRNAFRRADRTLYDRAYAQDGDGIWNEVFKDRIVRIIRWEGSGHGVGRMLVKYIARLDTQWEREYDVWVPSLPDALTHGYYVPNDDCPPRDGLWTPFQEDTLIPFEIVTDIQEAQERYRRFGLPEHAVSEFTFVGKLLSSDDRLLVRDFAPVRPLSFNIGILQPDEISKPVYRKNPDK